MGRFDPANLSRLAVLVVLVVTASVDYGHDRQASHWFAVAAYGLATSACLWLRWPEGARAGRWLSWAVVVADASVAVCVIVDHVPRSNHEARHAIDALSVLPAFLFLLQTGLRRRLQLLAAYVGLVSLGWLVALAGLLDLSALRPVDGLGVLVRQTVGLATFSAAATLVAAAVAWTLRSARAAELQRSRLERFLPGALASDLAHGRGVGVSERHASLLAVDLRGFSKLARERDGGDLVNCLLEFRRLVHDAVCANGGIVDKYIGDGVLALFLDTPLEHRPSQVLSAVIRLAADLSAWNDRRRDGQPYLRAIVSVHRGKVLAGVFDDGRRAEFTALGPAMNALSRIELRAKRAEVDLVASGDFLRTMRPEVIAAAFDVEPLTKEGAEAGLPELFSLVANGPPGRPGNRRALWTYGEAA